MSGSMWTNAAITLYHGTLWSHAQDIVNHIDINKCRKRGDFAQGFYTTTSRTQAVEFANKRYRNESRANPATTELAALLWWKIDRLMLGKLENLVFVRAKGNDDYWRFVSYCWSGGSRRHKPTEENYDTVYGPVNLDFKIRGFLPDSDQISFHTPDAIGLLEAGQRQHIMGNPRL